MKYFILIDIFLLFSVILKAQNDFSTFEEEPSWAEEFEYEGVPNSKYWSYRIASPPSLKNQYVQHVENAFVQGGKLIIRATKENESDTRCSSVYIHTSQKVQFKYGKLEIRAKITTGAGGWPAIWMLTERHPSKYYGEIDIMEYIDCWKSKAYQSNVHIVIDKKDNAQRKQYHSKILTDVTEYHIYTLKWYKNKLVFLLDGQKTHEYNKKQNELWPFDMSAYLILNIAYGGWGAQCGMQNAKFPYEMSIDWIRYYKLKK